MKRSLRKNLPQLFITVLLLVLFAVLVVIQVAPKPKQLADAPELPTLTPVVATNLKTSTPTTQPNTVFTPQAATNLDAEVQALLKKINDPNPETKKLAVVPELRERLEVDKFESISLTSALTQIKENLYVAQGKIKLKSTQTLIDGELYFTRVGSELLLTAKP